MVIEPLDKVTLCSLPLPAVCSSASRLNLSLSVTVKIRATVGGISEVC